jgi:hypothetical protein
MPLSDDLIVAFMGRIDTNLSELNATTVKQQVILEEHIQRTAANEAHIKSVEQRVIPLEDHIKNSAWMSSLYSKILAVAVSLGSIISTGIAIYKFFF